LLEDGVPASHADLLDRALPAAITIEMPDGRFQSTVVWFNHDEDHVLLNTIREFRRPGTFAQPRATLLGRTKAGICGLR
jgi:hypothetical protein